MGEERNKRQRPQGVMTADNCCSSRCWMPAPPEHNQTNEQGRMGTWRTREKEHSGLLNESQTNSLATAHWTKNCEDKCM